MEIGQQNSVFYFSILHQKGRGWYDYLTLKIGTVKLDFFSDCGRKFLYLYTEKHWWRFIPDFMSG